MTAGLPFSARGYAAGMLVLFVIGGCTTTRTADSPVDGGTVDATSEPPVDAASELPVSAWTERRGVPFAFRVAPLPDDAPRTVGWRLDRDPPPTPELPPLRAPWAFDVVVSSSTSRAVVDQVLLDGRTLVIRTSERTLATGCSEISEHARPNVRVVFETAPLIARIDDVVVEHRVDTLSCPTIDALRERVERADTLISFFEDSRMNVLDTPVDTDTLRAEVKALLYDRGAGELAWAFAARRILLAFPIGHASLGALDAASARNLPSLYTSAIGACARPSGDEFVISYALDVNPLGLRAGDRVVAVNNEEGAAMFATALASPSSATAVASEANARIQAALASTAFFIAGTEWQVEAPSGERRTIVVPEDTMRVPVDCTDAFGRRRDLIAESVLLDDGVAVIRVPRWYPERLDSDDFEVIREQVRGAVLAAFESVRDLARAIVWDVRGNQGGDTQVALEVVAGFAGARTTRLATCEFRATVGQPVVFEPNPFVELEVIPEISAFTFAGPSVILADGLGLSANDYFLLGAAETTDVPIVGTGASAGYGAAGAPRRFDEPFPFVVVSDSNRCLDALGRPLEGRIVEPDRVVELRAEDLAAGRDTQLEAALELLAGE